MMSKGLFFFTASAPLADLMPSPFSDGASLLIGVSFTVLGLFSFEGSSPHARLDLAFVTLAYLYPLVDHLRHEFRVRG